MRLDKTEKKALFYAVEEIDYPVFLFGSRVDNSKKGGDIDIVILSGEKKTDIMLEVERRFLSKCEEKIDVVILNPDDSEDREFFHTLKKERIR